MSYPRRGIHPLSEAAEASLANSPTQAAAGKDIETSPKSTPFVKSIAHLSAPHRTRADNGGSGPTDSGSQRRNSSIADNAGRQQERREVFAQSIR